MSNDVQPLKVLIERFCRIEGAIFFDFDGVFTDNKVVVDASGNESVACCKYDSMGISMLRSEGVRLYVISSETNEVVVARCRKLNIEVHHQIKDKGNTLLSIAKKDGVILKKSIFVGNDKNDIPAFKQVGISLCPFDSHHECIAHCDGVLTKSGGNGAIRELSDLIISQIISQPLA